MISRTLLVVCLLFIIAGCASPVKQIKDSSIPFQRPYYSVLPPQGDNWYYARGENAGSFNLTFGKQSSSGTHTIAGLISELHSSVDFDNPNEFLNFVIKMRDMDMDPRRYNIIDYSISLDSKFGEYCIKYYYEIEDYKAANRRYEDKLALNISGYTFIHPYFHDVMIDISYSERGLSEEIDTNFTSEAKKFIEGIDLKVFNN